MPSRIECDEAIAKLLEFLDGELEEASRSQVERHIQTCRGCFSRAEFERRLRRRVAATGSTRAPESLRRRLHRLMERY